jgi:hypothetical protein
MNPLILFLCLDYFVLISAASFSGDPEVIEILSSDNEDSPRSTGDILGSGMSSFDEPLTLSGSFLDSSNEKQRKRRISDNYETNTTLIQVHDEDDVENIKEDKPAEEEKSESLKRFRAAVVEKMDVRALASIIALLNLDEIRGHLIALGEEAKIPIKDTCGWNLLHEAVYTDYYDFAQILITEFGFDPNAFDPYFGSAVYLVQSRSMAELLKSNRANLSDQRPCALYNSAIESARARRKMALVSMVELLAPRLAKLHSALSQAQSTSSSTKFTANRSSMFKTAMNTISRRRTTSCASLDVVFLDEQGKDAGGLSVEFVNLIKEEIIKRGRVLRFDAETGFYQLRPDPLVLTKEDASRESEDLNEIKLLGYIVGLSIFHKVPLSIHFSPIMYEIMCGLSPNGDIDMMAVLRETDRTYYNSLRRMGDVPECNVSDYTFPLFKRDEIRSWKSERGDLKNKLEIIGYTPLAAKERVYAPYENSLAYFKAGLDSAISTDLIYNYITPDELKTIMIGENDYTASDWRAACRPPTHPSEYNEQYEWFWRAVDEITPEQRTALLKYVTALVALPIGGFRALSFQPSVLIIEEPKKTDRLPCSSTCFNQIRIYPITTYNRMKEVLILAGEYGSTGFGDN